MCVGAALSASSVRSFSHIQHRCWVVPRYVYVDAAAALTSGWSSCHIHCRWRGAVCPNAGQLSLLPPLHPQHNIQGVAGFPAVQLLIFPVVHLLSSWAVRAVWQAGWSPAPDHHHPHLPHLCQLYRVGVGMKERIHTDQPHEQSTKTCRLISRGQKNVLPVGLSLWIGLRDYLKDYFLPWTCWPSQEGLLWVPAPSDVRWVAIQEKTSFMVVRRLWNSSPKVVHATFSLLLSEKCFKVAPFTCSLVDGFSVPVLNTLFSELIFNVFLVRFFKWFF